MGRRLGLVIGVNTYQDATFRPLQFAEADARTLAQWLVNPRGGEWGASDVQLVLGTQATYEQTESLITHLCVNVAGPDDLVLLYFAGHAFLDEMNGEGHLALANTDYRQPTTALHLPSLTRYVIGRSRAAQVLVILDCFQTGRLWSRQRSSPYDSRPLFGPALPNALQQGGGRMYLCSCRGNELVPERGERGLGMLAYRTIVGLSGPARDAVTGQVTLQQLHAFLFSALGAQQQPQLFGHESSPFILAGDMSFDASALPPFSDTPYVQPVARSQLLEQAAQRTSPTAERSAQVVDTHAGPLQVAAGRQQQPQPSSVLLKQAQQLLQMQNPGEAFKIVERVLEDEPGNVTALILKSQLLGMAGRFQDALAAVEQIVRIDANNALAWSMRAALLTNMGQFLDALPAIERSIELDPRNPETRAIKATIMASLTPARDGFRSSQPSAAVKAQRRGGPLSFFIGVSVQLFGLIVGMIGAGLLILLPDVPVAVAFALESLGLALLCVNAARGCYLYGATRFLLTFLTTLVVVGMLGGLYKFGYIRVIEVLRGHPPLLGPILFLLLWLVAAATLPLPMALGGLIWRLVRGVGRRRG